MKCLILVGLVGFVLCEETLPHMKCANDVMLSDAGKMKIQEIFKLPADGNRPSIADAMKKFEEARTALQGTDADKVDKWLTCLSHMTHPKR